MHMVQIKKSYKIMENIFSSKNPNDIAIQARNILKKRKKLIQNKYLYNRFNDQNVVLKFNKLF